MQANHEISEAPVALNIDNQQVLHTIQGEHGQINILKPQREVTKSDEDIHTLIARILLKKEKRLALGE
jgi:hypothetical protein